MNHALKKEKKEKQSIREISRFYFGGGGGGAGLVGKIAVCLFKTDDLPWARGWRPAMSRLVAEWLMTE